MGQSKGGASSQGGSFLAHYRSGRDSLRASYKRPLPVERGKETPGTKAPIVLGAKSPSPAIPSPATTPALSRFSSQLASIAKAAEATTRDLRQTYGMKPLDALLFTAPSNGFSVGRLRCKYPSPVHFYRDKCIYRFHHPHEAAVITMEMFYCDMRSAQLQVSQRRLVFRIDHPLIHYKGDYNHDNSQHLITIDLASGSDTSRVAQEIMPRVRGGT
ncbi:unnamed protein product [Chrysoparadoxa australica]